LFDAAVVASMALFSIRVLHSPGYKSTLCPPAKHEKTTGMTGFWLPKLPVVRQSRREEKVKLF
jgi:hypothetical protein